MVTGTAIGIAANNGAAGLSQDTWHTLNSGQSLWGDITLDPDLPPSEKLEVKIQFTSSDGVHTPVLKQMDISNNPALSYPSDENFKLFKSDGLTEIISGATSESSAKLRLVNLTVANFGLADTASINAEFRYLGYSDWLDAPAATYDNTGQFSETTIASIEPYVPHYFSARIKDVSTTGQVRTSYWIDFYSSLTSTPAAPTSPIAGTPQSLSANSIRWYFTDNSDNEDGFRMHDTNHTVEIVKATPSTYIEHIDEANLLPNTTYTRHFHAYNSIGESDASTTASRATLAEVPTSPSASDGTLSGQVQVSWTAPSTGANHYHVYRDGAAGTGALVYNASATSFKDSVSDYGSHTYYIYAVNSNDENSTDYISDTGYIQLGLVGTPNIGAPTAVSSGSIRWDFYDTSHNNSEAGFWLHDASHNVLGSASTNLTYEGLVHITENGLLPNTVYTRHVHAYNASGESYASADASMRTLSEAPTAPVATDGTLADQIQVSWTASASAQKYRVYKDSRTGAGALVYEGVNTGFVDAVSDDFWHTYYIYSVNSDDKNSADYAADGGYRIESSPANIQAEWKTKGDFENNASTTGGSTTRSSVGVSGVNPADDASVTLANPGTIDINRPTIGAGVMIALGLKNDGTVAFAGENSGGWFDEIANWRNIVAVDAYYQAVGLKEDGTVVIAKAGSNGYNDVRGWTDIKAIAAGHDFTLGLKSNGKVVAIGPNYDGQINVGSWTNIKAIAAGTNFSLGLKNDGTIVGTGIGSLGGSNVKAISAGAGYSLLKNDGTVETRYGPDTSSWAGIKAIDFGHDHVVGLKNDGTVVSAGGPDVSNWRDIASVYAGWNYTVGLKKDGSIVIAQSENIVTSFYTRMISNWTGIRLPYVPGTISGLKFNAGSSIDANWSKISWTGDMPAETSIRFRTRGAETEAGLASALWSDYYLASLSTITTSASKWLEVEATLDGTDVDVPSLDNIRVTADNNTYLATKPQLGTVAASANSLTVPVFDNSTSEDDFHFYAGTASSPTVDDDAPVASATKTQTFSGYFEDFENGLGDWSSSEFGISTDELHTISGSHSAFAVNTYNATLTKDFVVPTSGKFMAKVRASNDLFAYGTVSLALVSGSSSQSIKSWDTRNGTLASTIADNWAQNGMNFWDTRSIALASSVVNNLSYDLSSYAGQTVRVTMAAKGVYYGPENSYVGTMIVDEAGINAENAQKTVGNLTPNTKYYIRSRAHDHTDNRYSDYSSEVSSYTLANNPTIASVNQVSGTEVKVTVDPSGNPTNTEYAIFNDRAGKYLQSDGTLGDIAVYRTYDQWGGLVGFTNTGLTPGIGYTYKVRARNGDGVETAWSSVVGSAPLASAPTLPVATDGTLTDQIQVSWSASLDADHYHVYRDGVAGTGTLVYNSTGTSFIDPISNNSLHTYYIYSANFDDLNSADYVSDTGFRAAPLVGNPPASTTPTVLSSASIRWNFTDNTTNEDGFKLHDDLHNVKATSAANSSSIVEGGLLPNTAYTRHIHAYNLSGESAASASISATTLSEAPTAPVATDGTLPGQIQVSWTASPSASHYHVYKDGPAGTGTLVYNNTGTSFIENISNAVAHTYYVYSVNSEDINSADFITDTGYAAVSATWSTKGDFENNASTTGTATTMKKIGLSGVAAQDDSSATILNPDYKKTATMAVAGNSINPGFSLAVKPDGTLWSTGSNNYGQLGLGDTVDRDVLTSTGLTDVLAVSAGAYSSTAASSLALKSDGSVWSTGSNGFGQLGIGSTVNKNTFTQTNLTSGVTAIAAGGSHSLVLKSNGTVWATGYNGTGALGIGTSANGTYKTDFTQVKDSSGGFLTGVISISGGSNHSLAVKSDGSLWSTGLNVSPVTPTTNGGQLGLGDTVNRNSFTKTNLTDVVAASAGSWSSLALKSDGTVWAAGSDEPSMGIGSSTTNIHSTFVQNSLTGVEAIAAGVVHSLALKYDNSLWGAGSDTNGALSIPSDSSLKPSFTQTSIDAVKHLQSDYSTQGTISGLKKDAGVAGFNWSNILWNSVALPANTSIKIRVKAADTEAGLTTATWSSYFTQNTAGSTSGTGSLSAITGQWLEAEVLLESTDRANVPTLNDFTIN